MQIQSNLIENFFHDQLKKRSVNKAPANYVIKALINASLRGIDSHGVNLFSHYLDCIDLGRIKPNNDPNLKIQDASIICDANQCFSYHASQKLLEKMSLKSDELGMSVGIIVNSDHIGAVGIHGTVSGIKNKIILGFTNADPLANTPDGKSVVFGTNPISLIYTNGEGETLYIDLATTLFSMNKVKNYRRISKALPVGVARDINKNITLDPNKAETLEPIGNYKGFALAYLVEILTSGLSGSSISKDIMCMYGTDLSKPRSISHTFIMIDSLRFSNGGEDFVWKAVKSIRSYLENDQLNNSPGIKELLTKKQRLKDGIPILDDVYLDWKNRGFKDN